MGYGEAASEEGVTLDTYSNVLLGMQEQAVEVMNGVLDPSSEE